MENLEIYEKSRVCPPNALRPIQGGKLKGKSDINPVWRIKQLTELFGPCGIGWKLCNTKYWTEPGADGAVSAWCSTELKIKVDGEWSDGIEGVGGSMLVELERGKLVTNDEAFKMANTDAISVCCKMLGFAADVYWEADRTKYTSSTEPPAPVEPARYICSHCGKEITAVINKGTRYSPEEIKVRSGETYGRSLCWECMKLAQQELAEEQKVNTDENAG